MSQSVALVLLTGLFKLTQSLKGAYLIVKLAFIHVETVGSIEMAIYAHQLFVLWLHKESASKQGTQGQVQSGPLTNLFHLKCYIRSTALNQTKPKEERLPIKSYL